jgi:hypothetical protein
VTGLYFFIKRKTSERCKRSESLEEELEEGEECKVVDLGENEEEVEDLEGEVTTL